MRVRVVAAALLVMFLMGCTERKRLAHPALSSKVPSIQIALAHDDSRSPPSLFHDQETQYCSVMLHNLSSRGVVAFVLSDGEDPLAGIAWSRETRGTRDHPAIRPRGDSQKELFTFGQAGPVRRQQIIIAAAIFSDGSYEGDMHVAAKLKGQEFGAFTLHRLIKPAVDRIVQEQSMDDEARTARIKDTIFHIPSQPKGAASQSLQTQFPDLPMQEVVADLADGLDAAKNNLWGELYGSMQDHVSLAEWTL